jgi:S-adenosylmethionine decarboxylase
MGCHPDRLHRDGVRTILVALPDHLGLTRVSDPELFEHRSGTGMLETVAGVVLLAQSHVSAHGFPAERAVHVDLFSCKPVDLLRARTFVAEFFGTDDIRERVIERGAIPEVTATPAARLTRAR